MVKKQNRFRRWLIFCAVAASAAHFVRADMKFRFLDRNDPEYVKVTKVGENPFKFKFSRCKVEGDCIEFGSKRGYTLEDVRIALFKLEEKREKGKLSSADSRDYDALQEIIEGIEAPRMHYPQRNYNYPVKGSVDQFVRLVRERISAK